MKVLYNKEINQKKFSLHFSSVLAHIIIRIKSRSVGIFECRYKASEITTVELYFPHVIRRSPLLLLPLLRVKLNQRS